MAIEPKTYVKCGSCDHAKEVDRRWICSRLKVEPSTSSDDLQWHLLQNKKKFKCEICGAHNAEFVFKSNTPALKKDEVKKRYIDEGIGGTREDNKKMRGRQWARNKNPTA